MCVFVCVCVFALMIPAILTSYQTSLSQYKKHVVVARFRRESEACARSKSVQFASTRVPTCVILVLKQHHVQATNTRAHSHTLTNSHLPMRRWIASTSVDLRQKRGGQAYDKKGGGVYVRVQVSSETLGGRASSADEDILNCARYL